jgi:hypothetical protein
MESLSQAEVGSALQVYFNLGQLRQVSQMQQRLLTQLRPFKVPALVACQHSTCYEISCDAHCGLDLGCLQS